MTAAAATPLPSRNAEALEAFFHKMPKRCLSVEFTVLGILLHEEVSRGKAPVTFNVKKIADWACVTEPSAVDAARRLEGKGLIKMWTYDGVTLVRVIDTMLEAAAK